MAWLTYRIEGVRFFSRDKQIYTAFSCCSHYQTFPFYLSFRLKAILSSRSTRHLNLNWNCNWGVGWGGHFHCIASQLFFFSVFLFFYYSDRAFEGLSVTQKPLWFCQHAVMPPHCFTLTPTVNYDIWSLMGGQVWPIYRTVSNVPVWIFRALTRFKSKASLLKGFKR